LQERRLEPKVLKIGSSQRGGAFGWNNDFSAAGAILAIHGPLGAPLKHLKDAWKDLIAKGNASVRQWQSFKRHVPASRERNRRIK
jgi:hypothetical protein